MKKERVEGIFLKSFVLAFVFLFLISIFSFAVIAQEKTTFVDADRTPDSWLYGFELWQENRQIRNAETTEERLALEIGFLKERYAEMHVLAQEGDSDALTAAEHAEELYSQISTETEQLIDENRNDQS